MRFVSEVESTHSLRVSHRSGMAFPAHRTALGLSLLAELRDDEIAALYAPDRLADGEETPPHRRLMTHMRAIRQQGFALNRGLSERGVLAIARAVHDGNDTPVAAVGIAMPSSRFQPSQIPAIAATLTHAAEAIQQSLS